LLKNYLQRLITSTPKDKIPTPSTLRTQIQIIEQIRKLIFSLSDMKSQEKVYSLVTKIISTIINKIVDVINNNIQDVNVKSNIVNEINLLAKNENENNDLNILLKQINPKKLIIIDAADMGLKPGKIRIVPKEKIGVMTISTHGIPTSVLMNYLEKYVKEVILIGIQPQNMSGEINIKIKEKANFLVEIIKNKKISTLSVLK